MDKITKRFTNYTSEQDVVPVLSREFNLLVDEVLAAEESSDISLKANIASPTFTGTVTVPANGVTFTSNGALVKAGAHSVTLTSSATTNVTLPTTGTLATLAGSETLSGKTLTAPKFADLGFIADPTGAAILAFDAGTTPVNYLQVANSAAGTTLSVTALGTDTNIGISYNTKGSGAHRFQEQSATGDTIAILPQTGGGAAFTGYITSADLAADVTWTLPATTGTLALTASPTFTGTVALPDTTKAGHTDGQVFVANSFMCPTPGAAEWTPSALGVTLPTDSSAKKCWVPLDFLKVGDEIVSFTVVGNSLEAAAITLDCKLVSLTGADPITVTDVTGGAITQHTADGLIQAQKTLTAVETVATNMSYNFELLGTCGSGDSLSVIGIHVVVNRK